MSTTVEMSVKPLKGKYDGRVAANKRLAKERHRAKPLRDIHLSRNTAAKLFRNLNLYERFIQLMNTDDERLQFEVMRYLWDRLEGKPFVATNPNDSKSPQVYVDARVQTAIDKYVAMPEPKQLTQAAEKAGGGQGN